VTDEKKPRRRAVPTAHRTLEWLRRHGCRAGITEQWISFHGELRKNFKGTPGVRRDLFGFIDIIAMEPKRAGLLGINSCSDASIAEHKALILGEGRQKGRQGPDPKLVRENAIEWLQRHNRIALYGWKKRRKEGREVWVPRVEPVTLGDFGLDPGRTEYLAHVPGVGYLRGISRGRSESGVETWSIDVTLFPEVCPCCLAVEPNHRKDCAKKRLLFP
jgi:hypothetical protein